jgi:glycosyltransferase involved in cell wall biosynthesis
MNRDPFISVIVPVHNGSEFLNRCLDALLASSYQSYEIIVVDDASTDDSAEISRKKGAVVFQLPHKSGPAAARNYGADKARGDILLFIDSDVLVEQDTIARVASDFMSNPDTSALFGSYDDSPSAPDFLSQFRNLLHHFIHQNSNRDAKTFWAGCGAIQRVVFRQLSGFDERRYSKPSIEDIELGFRMRKMGYRILLDKEIQVKHLKKWEWLSWLRTDIFQRAVPWSQLILESGLLPGDLNLRISHRISALFVGLLALLLPFFFLDAIGLFGIVESRVLFILFLTLLVTLLILNINLYAFFLRKRGLKFMVFTIPMHFLYYFYSSLSFGVCWILHKFTRIGSGLKKK